MGRLPLHRLPRRRRRRASAAATRSRSPATSPSSSRRSGASSRRAACSTARSSSPGRAVSTSTPCPNGSIRPRSGSASSRESTPASFVAFDLLALGDASLMETPYAQRRKALEKHLRKARPPVHVTPVDPGPRRRGRLVRPLRGGRPRRRRRQAGGPALPAGQAGDAQGQARAHRRLRGGGLPHAQGRRRRRIAAARPVRRRRGRCTTSVWPRASAWPGGASWSTSSSRTGPTRRGRSPVGGLGRRGGPRARAA